MTRDPADAGGEDQQKEARGFWGSPKNYSQTVRQLITGLLSERELTAREISQIAGIREREVYEHLPHIARSAAALGKKLRMVPFRCLACGFLFEERRRFTRPSRCPRCKQSRLETPLYHIS